MPGDKLSYKTVLPAGLGVIMLLLFLQIGGLNDLRQNIPVFLCLYAAIWTLYAAGAYAVLKGWGCTRFATVIIIVIGVACRMVLIPEKPSLSDDIYRYMWDGKTIAGGINPYMYSPGAEQLRHQRDEYYPYINHKNLKTIYPPLAEAVFFCAAAVSKKPVMQKIMFTTFDILIMAVIVILLLLRDMRSGLVLIYAWNPLVILEFSHSGHVDSLGIFFLMLSLLLFEWGKKNSGFVSLALSFLVKYFSIILLPFFVLKKKYIKHTAVFAIAVIVGVVPFIAAGSRIFESFFIYAKQWEHNAALYSVFKSLFGNSDAVRFLFLTALIVLAVYWGYTHTQLLRYSYLMTGSVLLLSPTLHPWYVCWIVPFLCFFPNPAWILLTGLIAGSYWVLFIEQSTSMWSLPVFVMWLEYVPFYALLIFGVLWDRLKTLSRKRDVSCA